MSLPPLYGALEPLSAARHGRLRWRDPGPGFAAPQPLPLALDEIGRAARHAPVVFAPEPPHAPFLLWPGPRPGAHVPRYLRRYPFLLARLAPGREELALCLDPGAPHLSETEGEPLFDAAGRPTPLAERAFGFARALEEGLLAAQAFGAGLARLGLLAPAALPAENGNATPRAQGFRAAHREAFMRLSGDQLAMLRDQGWLEPLVAHFLSALALEG
ncbi:MAG: SapC family protein [Roseococcus sp.]|jgi:hypothetical protein